MQNRGGFENGILKTWPRQSGDVGENVTGTLVFSEGNHTIPYDAGASFITPVLPAIGYLGSCDSTKDEAPLKKL